jgi:hypothetical protein
MEGGTMRHMPHAVSGSIYDLHSWHLKAVVLHAVLSRHLREFVLSAVTLLSMSLFTIITIVLIVTTINDSLAADTGSQGNLNPAMSVEESLPAATENTAHRFDLMTESQASSYAALFISGG